MAAEVFPVKQWAVVGGLMAAGYFVFYKPMKEAKASSAKKKTTTTPTPEGSGVPRPRSGPTRFNIGGRYKNGIRIG